MNYEKEFEKAIYNLLWLRRCMAAWGIDKHVVWESTSYFLERHGYGHEDGWGFTPNEKAIALMDRDDLAE
jgi:hypothetical protein